MKLNHTIEVLSDLKEINSIRNRHRLLKYVDINGEIVSKRASTILQYCDYILALIASHGIYGPYTMLNLRDKKLLDAFHIDYNTGYSRMTDFLKRTEVIELTDNSYCFWEDNLVCQEYMLNIENYVDLYEDGIIREQILYPGMFYEVSAENVSDYWEGLRKVEIDRKDINVIQKLQALKMDYSCFNRRDLKKYLYRKYEDKDKRVPLDVILQSDFYKENLDTFKVIESGDYVDYTPTILPNIFTYEEENMLASYASYCAEENPIYQKCLLEKDYLNKYLEYPIKMRMSKSTYKDEEKTHLFLKPACRQYNRLCSVENGKMGRRDKMMIEKGFDLSFDIHSTIFTLMRFLNTGNFDIEWDIKREIFPNYDELKKDEKWGKQFKTEVLMRCAFSRNLPSAWFGYSEKAPGYHYFSFDEFKRVYDETQRLTGGTKKFQCNIFLYESLWELMVMHDMVDRNYDVANVYDNFYFKSTQTSIEEIKEIITNKIFELKEVL